MNKVMRSNLAFGTAIVTLGVLAINSIIDGLGAVIAITALALLSRWYNLQLLREMPDDGN